MTTIGACKRRNSSSSRSFTLTSMASASTSFTSAARGRTPAALLLFHGWPISSIAITTHPPTHRSRQSWGDPSDSFDVIVPSLSRTGLSDRPTVRGWRMEMPLSSGRTHERERLATALWRSWRGHGQPRRAIAGPRTPAGGCQHSPDRHWLAQHGKSPLRTSRRQSSSIWQPVRGGSFRREPNHDPIDHAADAGLWLDDSPVGLSGLDRGEIPCLE